jgi:hypothetical protein
MQLITTKFLLSAASACAVSAVSLHAATWPAGLPPHPRLLFNQQDIAVIQQRIATQPWAKAHFDSMKKEAGGWTTREVKLPDRGGHPFFALLQGQSKWEERHTPDFLGNLRVFSGLLCANSIRSQLLRDHLPGLGGAEATRASFSRRKATHRGTCASLSPWSKSGPLNP